MKSGDLVLVVWFLMLGACAPAPNPQDFSVPMSIMDFEYSKPCLIALKARSNPSAAIVGCFPLYGAHCTSALEFTSASEVSTTLSEITLYSQLHSQCSIPVSRVSSRLNAIQPGAHLLAYDIGGLDGPHVSDVNIIYRKVDDCSIMDQDTSRLVTPEEGLAMTTNEGLLAAEDDTGQCRAQLDAPESTLITGADVNTGAKKRFLRCYVGTSVSGAAPCPSELANDSAIQALIN